MLFRSERVGIGQLGLAGFARDVALELFEIVGFGQPHVAEIQLACDVTAVSNSDRHRYADTGCKVDIALASSGKAGHDSALNVVSRPVVVSFDLDRKSVV